MVSKVTATEDMAAIVARLVNPRYFVEATRESGYKGTSSAISELIDNSLQSKATQIHVLFKEHDDDAKEVLAYILDNGIGMSIDELAIAPQFGGSTRFNDRNGIGRFGMGLPNASVAIARRFEIYSRKSGGPLLYIYLDLDQLGGVEQPEPGFMTPIEVNEWPLPDALAAKFDPDSSGTLVIWKKCDRLEPKNVDGLKRKVTGYLGQAFRNFVYPIDEAGTPAHLITVNGDVIEPFDPLYLDPRAMYHGAEFKAQKEYSVSVPGRKGEKGTVTVKFSMLPVVEWQNLPESEKRTRRIFDNRGFSIVRNGREIEVTDRYFLTGRGGEGSTGRILNNDAWWGCEISFDAKLDEVFGVTHTKQDIRPDMQALQSVKHEISDTILTLRNEYERLKAKKTPAKTHPVEEKAARNDKFLPPVPTIQQAPEVIEQVLIDYSSKHKRENETENEARQRVQSKPYTIELESAKEGPFYRIESLLENTIVYVNTDHVFYTELYSKVEESPDATMAVSALLFAIARGERMSMDQNEGRKWYASQRAIWSNALHMFIGK